MNYNKDFYQLFSPVFSPWLCNSPEIHLGSPGHLCTSFMLFFPSPLCPVAMAAQSPSMILQLPVLVFIDLKLDPLFNPLWAQSCDAYIQSVKPYNYTFTLYAHSVITRLMYKTTSCCVWIQPRVLKLNVNDSLDK